VEGEPGCVEKQLHANVVASLKCRWCREGGGVYSVQPEIMEAIVDANDLLLGPGKRAEQVQLIIFRGEYNPLPAPALHD
jgi:hypothetical protein